MVVVFGAAILWDCNRAVVRHVEHIELALDAALADLAIDAIVQGQFDLMGRRWCETCKDEFLSYRAFNNNSTCQSLHKFHEDNGYRRIIGVAALKPIVTPWPRLWISFLRQFSSFSWFVPDSLKKCVRGCGRCSLGAYNIFTSTRWYIELVQQRGLDDHEFIANSTKRSCWSRMTTTFIRKLSECFKFQGQ